MVPSGKKNITLSDIAAALGVSKATVSLAINNDPRVAEDTRRKILSKIEEVGYVYNRGAAGLSTGRSNTVGLAVHDITNPYFTEVCRECEAILSQNDRLAFLCNTYESLDHQDRFIRALIEHRADGLILSPVAGTTLTSLRQLFKLKLPTVMIARYVEGAKLDFVGNDGFLAVRKITQHLLDLGHSRLAMVGGGQETSVSKNRRGGFFAAMKENGIGVDPALVINCDSTPEGGEEAISYILSLNNPPTAIVAFSDLVGIGILSGLHRRGLKPGEDMAVVGCDDIEESNRGYAQLTTMRIKRGEIGRKAAELLIRRINDPDAPVRHLHLEAELVVRKSCGTGRYPC